MKKVFFQFLFLLWFCNTTQAQLLPVETNDFTKSATYEECVNFYSELHKKYPENTSMDTMGLGDIGLPIYVFKIIGNGDKKLKLLVLNNIHPGEPEGTDASMFIAREVLCGAISKSVTSHLDIYIVCQYNVDGTVNRSCCSRANQNGPDDVGFRGNARNLDLNRDFIKCDSRNAKAFVQYFNRNKFHLMIDNHTSNGADYQYVLTYFHTRPEKLSPHLVPAMETLDRNLKTNLLKKGWPTAPYVETRKAVPDSGITAFWESGRYSTGFAALHHCIGFTVETHMFKPYTDRLKATHEFLLQFIQQAGKPEVVNVILSRYQLATKPVKSVVKHENIAWQHDFSRYDTILFKGYEFEYKQSDLTGQNRLYYNRNKPWERPIPYYRYFVPTDSVKVPEYYLIPWAWHEVVDRLQWNGISMRRMSSNDSVWVRASYIKSLETYKSPYEGHYVHYNVQTRDTFVNIVMHKGDYIVPVNNANYKFLSAVLEPRSPDSYFAWNTFDAILQQKEWFSDYIWIDKAKEILENDTALKQAFEKRKKEDPHFAENASEQLVYIYRNSVYYEKTHNLYPIYRIDAKP